jgi:guanylate kinase
MNDQLLQKLQSYRTPEDAKKLIKDTQIVFLVGITAAGKDTVMKELIKSSDYHQIISHTTRPPRENHGIMEIDGKDYHFVDFEIVNNMLDNGGYVEAKCFSGNVYGTSVAEIQMAHDEGKIAIADIEVQGVEEYTFLSYETITPIFILPPDFATWQQRLAKRHEENHMDPSELRKRLETAKVELNEALTKPYFEYVINKNLSTTVKIAGEIAHGNKSTAKNEQAKEVAKQLLSDLTKYLQQN